MASGNFEDLILRGLRSAQPAAGVPGRLYYVTDEGVTERDNGATWDDYTDGGGGVGIPLTGWIADAGTWSYSSADAPTFVISINADMTAVLSPGMRIKLTQTSVKYFIVTAVGAFSGGATLITVYGGTDYTLVSATITNPYYSVVKAPLGFPLDAAKWTVRVADTGHRMQVSPTQNTWYNLGSVSISLPIGAWLVRYQVLLGCDASSGTSLSATITLSTANNSESDAELSGRIYWIWSTSQTNPYIGEMVNRTKALTVAAKTPYYLNTRTVVASMADIYNDGDVCPTILEAVCAYL
jgi:hypothetical protein